MDPLDSSTPPRATVLIVDDEAMLLRYMARILHDAGHRVLTAQTGLEAWEIIDTSGADLQVVITDVAMPGVTGIELANRIRQRSPNLRFLYVSGRDLPPEAPAGPLLPKPFAPLELTAHVNALTASPLAH